MIKGLIFDMDGTIVPNMSYHRAAYEEQARRRGYKMIEPVTPKFFGWSNADVIRAVVPASVVEKFGADFLGDEREAIYREIYAGHVTLMKGLKEFLDEVIASGLKLTIGSAGPRLDVEFILRETGLKPLIKSYICGDDVTHGKPDPEIFNRACELLNLPPEQCVVFEDAVPGTKAGVAAGCKVVSLSANISEQELRQAGANLVVEDFTSISLEVLEAL